MNRCFGEGSNIGLGQGPGAAGRTNGVDLYSNWHSKFLREVNMMEIMF